ncbi:MAG: metal ABC transporter ATP-binding protein [Phycisphaerae bacterium]
MNDPPAVEMKQVSFAYDGPVVLADASLRITRGDFACIVGPNGGGKTTLLKLMLGLIKPHAGCVRVFGMPPEDARPRMAYMPQSARLDPRFPVTVMDVALMGRLGRSAPWGPFGKSDRAAALEALDSVGLADVAGRSLSALSSGQKQRVLIARALACEPELLLLDEPTANLDARAEDDLYTLLHRLNASMTVVQVSHDVSFVTGFVRKAICVNRTVAVHATEAVTGDVISAMYGHDVRRVRHDHCAQEQAHRE